MIKKPKNLWTAKEIEILMTVYANEGGVAALKLLPGRSETAMYTKVHALRIKFRKPAEKRKPLRTLHVWKAVEVEWLRRNYPKSGPQWCASYLGMTVKAVISKAVRLGVKFRETNHKKTAVKPEAPPIEYRLKQCDQVKQVVKAQGDWKIDHKPAVRSIFDMGVPA